jgi:hypothetical protein
MSTNIKCLFFNEKSIPTHNEGSDTNYGCINLKIRTSLDITNFMKDLGDTHFDEHYDIVWINGLDLQSRQNTENIDLFVEKINNSVKSIGTIFFDMQGEGKTNKEYFRYFDEFRDRLNIKNYKPKILWTTSRLRQYKDYDIFYRKGFELTYWVYCRNIKIKPFENPHIRKYFFSFLNGEVNKRIHRYTMLKKLIDLNGIIKSGLVSNLDTNTDLPHMVAAEMDDNENKFASGEDTIRNSYINLVSESDDGKDTIGFFITEKSVKPFLFAQFPIFLGKPGLVKHLREYGFDMFDDLIDHSYDDIEDIDERTDAIYMELLKMNTHGGNIQNMVFGRYNRFLNNYNTYLRLVNNSKNIVNEIKNWLLYDEHSII